MVMTAKTHRGGGPSLLVDCAEIWTL